MKLHEVHKSALHILDYCDRNGFTPAKTLFNKFINCGNGNYYYHWTEDLIISSEIDIKNN